MFEPFQDGNQHFFGTISLSWFVMKSIPKTYSFNWFLTKSLRETFLNGNLYFCGSYFQFLSWNCVFWAYLESNAAVTLHLKTLRSQINCFKRLVYLLRKNLKFFNPELWINVKFFFLNILLTKCCSVRKRVKNTLFRTLLHLVIKLLKKKNFTLIQCTLLNNLRFFINKFSEVVWTGYYQFIQFLSGSQR